MNEYCIYRIGSNNTNKLSPQERPSEIGQQTRVQIIQINLVLKNNNVGVEYKIRFK